MVDFGDFKYCTICLVTDVKMFEMNPTMNKIYIDLLQVKNQKRKMVQKTLFSCYECTHLMLKYWKFREKCTTAYTILSTITAGTFEVTEKCLNNIDRKKSQLQSKLSIVTDNYNITEYKENSNYENVEISIEKENGEFFVHIKPETTNEDDSNNLLIPSADTKSLHADSYSVDMRQDLSDTQAESKLYTDNAEDTDMNNEEYMTEVLESDEFYSDIDDCIEESVESRVILDKEYKQLNAVIENNIILDEDNIKLQQLPINQGLKNNKRRSGPVKHNPDFNIDSEEDELNSILARYDVPDDITDHDEDEEKEQAIESTNNKTMLQKGKLKEKEEVIKTKDVGKKKLKGILATDLDFYESNATVTVLTPEEAMKELLKRKESLNYKRCKYKCEICFRGYNLLKTYKNHMKHHSQEEGSFECNFCKIWTPSKKSLHYHIEHCHKYKFACKHCPYVSYSTTQCRDHIMAHKGETHACKVCGKTFRHRHSVHSHYRLNHQLDIPCDLCGAMFGSDKGLMTHKYLLHKREVNHFKGPTCEECNVHFTDERAYKRHLVLSSKHKISNACRICGDAFENRRALKEHRKTHEKYYYKSRTESDIDWNLDEDDGNVEVDGDDGNIDQRNLAAKSRNEIKYQGESSKAKKKLTFRPCTHCYTPIFSKKEYRIHTLNEHPESEEASKLRCTQNKCKVCEICGKTFTMEAYLLVHQRIHTGERPYKCDQCGKKFNTEKVLNDHIYTHSEELNFTCDVCGKAFRTKDVLKKHMKYHSDLRPFKCASCERCFVHRYELKTHVLHVHNKVPWPVRKRTDRKRKRSESESET